MEMVFHLGAWALPHSNMSTMSLSAGSTGKTQACWAMYSLRMSFWTVPCSLAADTPCFSAAAMKKHQRIAAGPLIVIDTET